MQSPVYTADKAGRRCYTETIIHPATALPEMLYSTYKLWYCHFYLKNFLANKKPSNVGHLSRW